MFCRKCGAQLEEDAKFCEKCGTPTGAEQMPEEDKQSSATETVETSETPPKKPKKTMGRIIRKIIGRTLLIIILLIAILLLLDYLGVINTATIDAFMEKTGMTKETGAEDGPGEMPESESPERERTDADEYYAAHATIVSEVAVTESADVQTEQEVQEMVRDRGFTDYPISFEYSMSGEYGGTMEVEEASAEKHPIYQTYYVSTEGELWTIFVINGAVMANPVTYNTESGRDVQLLISETDTVTSYDSAKNKFYVIIPGESEAIVKTVDRIDAETLDKLTVEVIDEL